MSLVKRMREEGVLRERFSCDGRFLFVEDEQLSLSDGRREMASALISFLSVLHCEYLAPECEACISASAHLKN